MNQNGSNALICAVENPNTTLDSFKILIENRGSAALTDRLSNTILMKYLMHTAHKIDKQIVKLMIDIGINISHTNRYG